MECAPKSFPKFGFSVIVFSLSPSPSPSHRCRRSHRKLCTSPFYNWDGTHIVGQRHQPHWPWCMATSLKLRYKATTTHSPSSAPETVDERKVRKLTMYRSRSAFLFVFHLLILLFNIKCKEKLMCGAQTKSERVLLLPFFVCVLFSSPQNNWLCVARVSILPIKWNAYSFGETLCELSEAEQFTTNRPFYLLGMNLWGQYRKDFFRFVPCVRCDCCSFYVFHGAFMIMIICVTLN